jgi:hypothetical protein
MKLTRLKQLETRMALLSEEPPEPQYMLPEWRGMGGIVLAVRSD